MHKIEIRPGPTSYFRGSRLAPETDLDRLVMAHQTVADLQRRYVIVDEVSPATGLPDLRLGTINLVPLDTEQQSEYDLQHVWTNDGWMHAYLTVYPQVFEIAEIRQCAYDCLNVHNKAYIMSPVRVARCLTEHNKTCLVIRVSPTLSKTHRSDVRNIVGLDDDHYGFIRMHIERIPAPEDCIRPMKS